MAARNYAVRCRDVDGSSVRYYAKLDAAVARFEEMSGIKVADALAEMFWPWLDANPGCSIPGIDAVRSVRAVSMFGCAVSLECVSAEALARADAARAVFNAKAADDWCVVSCSPIYDNRDGICGSRRDAVSVHASEEEANAALGELLNSFGEDGPGECDGERAGACEGTRLRVTPIRMVVSPPGLEPGTTALKVRCSTN